MDYKQRIYEGLIALGIVNGDSLLVHSSLNAIGKFDNRCQIIIDTLLELLGPSGTLLMPALSYKSVTAENPLFDVVKSPSCVGGLTEYFRLLPESVRSLHPTHSVCGLGAKITFLLDNHIKDDTPCGPNSPFSKLKDIGGKILFLGCSLRSNTSMHAIEELCNPEYLFDSSVEYTVIDYSKTKYKKKYLSHDFMGYRQHYDRVLDILDQADYSFAKVLNADCYLLKATILWKKAYVKLKKDPSYFVDKIRE